MNIMNTFVLVFHMVKRRRTIAVWNGEGMTRQVFETFELKMKDK